MSLFKSKGKHAQKTSDEPQYIEIEETESAEAADDFAAEDEQASEPLIEELPVVEDEPDEPEPIRTSRISKAPRIQPKL